MSGSMLALLGAKKTITTYATWDPNAIGSNFALSNGNLDASYTALGVALATMGKSTGKWYWEIKLISGGGNSMPGIAKSNVNLNQYLGQDANGWSYYAPTGNKYNNATPTGYGSTFTTNDVIGIALDAGGGTLTFYKNGVSQGTAFTGLSGTFYPAVGNGSSGDSGTLRANFGASAFAYSVPSGYNAGVYTQS